MKSMFGIKALFCFSVFYTQNSFEIIFLLFFVFDVVQLSYKVLNFY